MKKIYCILVSVVALLSFSQVVQAQKYSDAEKDKQIHYSDAGGLCYSKTISQPESDGTYWITLESFVTGELIHVSGKDKPVDIVLVLDLSSSMTKARDNDAVEQVTVSLSYKDVLPELENYDVDNPKTNYLYRYSGSGWWGGGGYAQIFGEKDENTGRYYLYYIEEGMTSTKHYLTSNGGSTDRIRDAAYVTDPMQDIVKNVSLYTGASRIRDLQNAVIAFIDEVDKNDRQKKDENGKWVDRTDNNGNKTRLGNAISIVTFNGSASNLLHLTELSDNNILTIKEKVNDFVLAHGTKGGLGVAEANNELKTRKNTSRYSQATRSVVMFTDGEQTDDYLAVDQAYYSKHEYSATVFSVALLDASTRNRETVVQNMEYVSSNYPDAESVSKPGDKKTYAEGEEEINYFFEVSGNDVNLSKVFTSIAASTSGGSDGDWGETQLSQVDIVSADFMLPTKVDSDAEKLIEIYVAPFNGTYVKNDADEEETYTVTIDGEVVTKKYLEFGKNEKPSDCLGKENHEPFVTMGEGILPTAKVSGNTITVDGFDYGANWCGEISEDGEISYHGHKLVVLIPIKMSDTTVGGSGARTNADGSGIYKTVNGKKVPIVDFTSPVVNLPINLYINKQGLNVGESAKFLIESSIDNKKWTPVTSVFVTRSTNDGVNDPITKITGLPATDSNNNDIVYRIVEEKWGWSYYPISYSHKLDDGRVYLLSTDQTKNPFKFYNKPGNKIDIKVRHAESKVINTFKTNGGPDPIDSK